MEILHGASEGNYAYTPRDTFNVIDKLSKKIDVKKKTRTSPLLLIKVSAFEPKLSTDIANSVIRSLANIVSEFKLSRVIEKKSFINNRISEVEIELKKSEDKIKVFREKNRNIFNSPALLLEESRLIRDTEIIMQVYGTLKSEYEMVRIEEVEKRSMLQVLDYPEPPKFKTSPLIKQLALLWAIVGFIITSSYIYFRDYLIKLRRRFTNY